MPWAIFLHHALVYIKRSIISGIQRAFLSCRIYAQTRHLYLYHNCSSAAFRWYILIWRFQLLNISLQFYQQFYRTYTWYSTSHTIYLTVLSTVCGRFNVKWMCDFLSQSLFIESKVTYNEGSLQSITLYIQFKSIERSSTECLNIWPLRLR